MSIASHRRKYAAQIAALPTTGDKWQMQTSRGVHVYTITQAFDGPNGVVLVSEGGVEVRTDKSGFATHVRAGMLTKI